MMNKQAPQTQFQAQTVTQNAAVSSNFACNTRLIGVVDSIMTRHSEAIAYNFVLLVAANGELIRGKWPAIPGEKLPALGDILRINIQTQSEDPELYSQSPGKSGKVCHSIVHWQTIPEQLPLELLNQLYSYAGHQEVVDRLVGIMHRISIPCIKALFIDVFSNPRIARPFMQVAASHQHHHSHTGGLLLHSVECAEWVERVAAETLNPKEAALAISVALLHDLGKIETMKPSNVNRMVDHEVLSLTLLEPALTDLQTQWSQGAYALRQMLSWSPSAEKFPKFPGSLLVKMADQYSTALSARNKAFQALPEHYYWASLKTTHNLQFFNRIN
ncbi:HD domain-containing protein [Methylomonas sp. AM2-LC]|uniref:HD domain-containing protein n=1 Tax=Methylomonas sp. AM2-LC TaxID=3153301 RepID=UPI0032636EBF